MIRALFVDYYRRHTADMSPAGTHVGFAAPLMKQIVDAGMGCVPVSDIGYYSAMEFAFIFQCRSTSVLYVTRDDFLISTAGIYFRMSKRKGKALNRPFLLDYPACAT